MFAGVGRRSTIAPHRFTSAEPASSAAHGPTVAPSQRTPRPGRPGAGLLVRMTTSWSWATRSAAMRRPSAPEPPASTTFTAAAPSSGGFPDHTADAECAISIGCKSHPSSMPSRTRPYRSVRVSVRSLTGEEGARGVIGGGYAPAGRTHGSPRQVDDLDPEVLQAHPVEEGAEKVATVQ